MEEIKKRILVVKNETHTLLENQERVIKEKFGDVEIEFVNVPAYGWTLSEMKNFAKAFYGETVIFLSPVPALIKLSAKEGVNYYVFHNDKREKKELPNGKIIMTVAQTGWEIV